MSRMGNYSYLESSLFGPSGAGERSLADWVSRMSMPGWRTGVRYELSWE